MRTLTLATAATLSLAACGLAGAAPEGPRLEVPVACEIGRTCEVQRYVDRDPGPGDLDYRCGRRTQDGHNGVDIRLLDMKALARGVDVLAAAPGKVARLRDGVADVSVHEIGQAAVANMECGNGVVIDHGDGWETQYCHLGRGSIRVKQGDTVAAGQPIARVGLSGQTEYPHLHMTVRRAGKVVDPFAPDPAQATACNKPQAGMWTPAAAKALSYKAGVILNAGFGGEAVTMPSVQAGTVAPFTAASPVLATYMLALELEKGDQLELVLTGPGGAPLASQAVAPLERDKAQQFQMIGKRRPPAGWPSGEYRAELRIHRAGQVVAEKKIATRL